MKQIKEVMPGVYTITGPRKTNWAEREKQLLLMLERVKGNADGGTKGDRPH